MSLDELDVSYKLFLDKSTILYGESSSGKSTIIVAMLKELQPYAEQIIVISPSDRSNRTYSSGIVPLPCIHYKITEKLLNDIWERQEALGAVYSRANEIAVLKRLFDRLNLEHVNKIISDVQKRQKEYENEIRNQFLDESTCIAKTEEMEKDFKKLTALIYKRYINENSARLMRMQLTEAEAFSLKYLNLNPRMILIFDDCSAQLKAFKSHRVIQDLFYQGRHTFITPIIACHSDKNLDSELRKNAFVNIFTQEKSAHAYFHRGTNDFDKEDKKEADKCCKIAFSHTAKFQKLVWIRLENRFYKFTAKLHPKFQFGSPIINEFCKMIQNDGVSISSENRFLQNFN
jgi:energy-coupling factor transporter ATP-binding protein EcfA2